MGITEIQQPTEELQLTDDQIVTDVEAGDEPVVDDSKEPIDEVEEFPDTLDDDEDVKNPHLVAQLRAQLTAVNREKAELRRRLEAPRIERTPKPTMDSCDYDEDLFEQRLLEWKENEAKAAQQEQDIAAAPNNLQDDFQQALQTYQQGAQKLGKPDFEAAQKAVTEALSPDQQSAILMAVKNPTQFFYALGRSPLRLAQLAQIQNPFKIAAEAARIEGSRMMPRKEPANIDTPVRGAAPLSHQDGDKKEKELLAAAEKDPAKFQAYRDYMKQKRQIAA